VDFVSNVIKDISGLSADEFIEKSISVYFEKILPQDLPLLQEAFEKAVREGAMFSVDYRIRHPNGDFRWVHDHGRAIRGEDGRITHVDGVISDTTERTKEKERFNQLVYYDALTNLPNRELFVDRLDQAIQQARRKKESGAVLALDLDHFKRINDTLGHPIGDQLIKAVSVRLLKLLFDSDTVTRISGGAFIILLPRVTKAEDAENVATKLLTAFKAPFLINEHELFTSCSIGIALFPNDGETSDILIKNLIRWKHPDLGFIPPMEFILVAEETGLIHPIGEWVLKTACAQKKLWDEQGFKDLRISVNLSARQFHYANLVDMVGDTIRKSGIDARCLDLELTESTIMDRLEETTLTLKRLKNMGTHISIDDFGTGYSSLMYLKTFPIDCVKIDKSFVNDVTTDPDDQAITHAIISMAHSLKLEVVAEGVETKEQLDLLKSQSCDIIQGYLFSKPIPANDIQPFLVSDPAKKILT
ncbi:MAG: GGDEF and EAL domain-containing protein, partial [Candidatus Omnitrophica bacterium]|nr:GGDEF and EAL domain-containing protein [Candidatus Omnitrophota bacterium]